MPGPLIESHAEWEEECSTCHTPFKRSSQSSLCVACHEEVGADVTSGSGFHGLSAGRSKRFECTRCHTDHAGRNADIIAFDEQTFDHLLTDFLLENAHATLDCAECHAEKAKFRAAKSVCVDCHADDDFHRGELGTDCDTCHSTLGWPGASFDHETTKFPLGGRHQTVPCGRCHENARYKGTDDSCVSCHRLDDIHAGQRGNDCGKCHGVAEWEGSSFDHDRNTDFRLLGRHAGVSCDQCHTTGVGGKDRPPQSCFGCHAEGDPHKGSQGRSCETCHDENGWGDRVFFDHDITRFPLSGLHTLASCEGCHVSLEFKETTKECAGCHLDADAHDGSFGKDCARCHNPNGWAAWIFDHDAETTFALVGAHGEIACATCHVSGKRMSSTTSCYVCHRRDDVHDGEFGKRCDVCHTNDSFQGRLLR